MALHPLCVAPHLLKKAWPLVRWMVETAFIEGRGDDSADIVYNQLRKKMAQLWLVWDDQARSPAAAIVTRLVMTRRGKVCLITACAGKRAQDWIRFLPVLEGFAKKEGCRYIRMSGRLGWRKYLVQWREPWITLEKQLQDVQ